MNGSMGSIRSLILGTKSEDVDGLRERYGAPPHSISHYQTEKISISEMREIPRRPRLSFSMDTVRICTHGINS